MGKWIDKINAAIWAVQQIMINICAAIAAFNFVIFWRGSDTGGHQGYSSVVV
jgi:hypothetical protein